MNELIVDKDIKIEDMIYEIGGKQVMLDSDLSRLYECKNGTKTINLAVKRNFDRFPSDFYFQLTEEEIKQLGLRFQSETLNSKGNFRGQHIKYLPYAFTEQGVAMLASVLRTPIATETSVKIMRTFVSMRHYLNENKDIYKSLTNINNKLIEHDDKLNYLFSKFDKKERLYLSNKEYDAYSDIKEIFNEAKENLIVIDNYVDKTFLDLIRNIDVKVILITKDNSKLTKLDIDKYNKQYKNLTIIYTNKFHDRYFIVDKNTIYHCGSSINYAGSKVFSINKLIDKIVKENLIKSVDEVIKNYDIIN